MAQNKVEISCPNCGGTEGDFLGFATFRVNNELVEKNNYKCMGCNHNFFVDRTAKNQHSEYLKGK